MLGEGRRDGEWLAWQSVWSTRGAWLCLTKESEATVVWSHAVEGPNAVWGYGLEGQKRVWGYALEGQKPVWGYAVEGLKPVWGHALAGQNAVLKAKPWFGAVQLKASGPSNGMLLPQTSAVECADTTQPCMPAGPPTDHNGAVQSTAGPPAQPQSGAAQGEPPGQGPPLQNGAQAPPDGSQEEELLRRANEIRREWALLSAACSKPWEEPALPLSHWDHLLREAVWMANDFGQVRFVSAGDISMLFTETLACFFTGVSVDRSAGPFDCHCPMDHVDQSGCSGQGLWAFRPLELWASVWRWVVAVL